MSLLVVSQVARLSDTCEPDASLLFEGVGLGPPYVLASRQTTRCSRDRDRGESVPCRCRRS